MASAAGAATAATQSTTAKTLMCLLRADRASRSRQGIVCREWSSRPGHLHEPLQTNRISPTMNRVIGEGREWHAAGTHDSWCCPGAGRRCNGCRCARRGSELKDSSTPTATTNAAPVKVWLCHHTGSWKHPYHLIHVSSHAVAAHRRHGDLDPGTGDSCPTTQPAGTKAHGNSGDPHGKSEKVKAPNK